MPVKRLSGPPGCAGEVRRGGVGGGPGKGDGGGGEGEIMGAAVVLEAKKPISMIPGSVNSKDAIVLSRQYRDRPPGCTIGYWPSICALTMRSL